MWSYFPQSFNYLCLYVMDMVSPRYYFNFFKDDNLIRRPSNVLIYYLPMSVSLYSSTGVASRFTIVWRTPDILGVQQRNSHYIRTLAALKQIMKLKVRGFTINIQYFVSDTVLHVCYIQGQKFPKLHVL